MLRPIESGFKDGSDNGENQGQIPERVVCNFSATDEERRIVFAVVYEPNVLDTYATFMTRETVEDMAYQALSMDAASLIDVQHDENPIQVQILESFIARSGDPTYPEGAWVLGFKILDDAAWNKVKQGELNGLSMSILARAQAVVVDIDYDPLYIGITEEAKGHRHLIVARSDVDGRIVLGATSQDENHSHLIVGGSVTETTNGHSHRFMLEE